MRELDLFGVPGHSLLLSAEVHFLWYQPPRSPMSYRDQIPRAQVMLAIPATPTFLMPFPSPFLYSKTASFPLQNTELTTTQAAYISIADLQ